MTKISKVNLKMKVKPLLNQIRGEIMRGDKIDSPEFEYAEYRLHHTTLYLSKKIPYGFIKNDNVVLHFRGANIDFEKGTYEDLLQLSKELNVISRNVFANKRGSDKVLDYDGDEEVEESEEKEELFV